MGYGAKLIIELKFVLNLTVSLSLIQLATSKAVSNWFQRNMKF